MGHVFKHPKYYEKLKASNKLVSACTDQEAPAGAPSSKPQASGTKQQAIEETVPHNDIEESLKD
jgi:hypothetical protein